MTIENDKKFSFLFLPYLPFFSNCDGYDSHISMSRLLEEHPDCTQIEPKNKCPVRQNPFTKERDVFPLGDTCVGINMQCQYEEEIDIT